MLVKTKDLRASFCTARERKLTSSKNCWVRRRMCLSSVSSRKFFFRASWLVFISFSSFSSFSNVACGETYRTESSAEGRVEGSRSPLIFRRESRHLHVDHVPWERDFRVLSCVKYGDVGLLYFFLHKSCKRKVNW